MGGIMKARTYKPESEVPFWKELKKSRPYLNKQQYCTLKGQAVKGKVRDARKGLQKILYRRNG